MLICPNKSSKEWKALSEAIGENQAHLAFIRNGNEIPTSAQEARELITNKGLLQSLETIPTLSEQGILDSLVNNNLVRPEGIQEDGRTWYQLNPTMNDIGQKVGSITQTYGTVLEYRGDYVSVDPESVKAWNSLAKMQPGNKLSTIELSKSFLSRVGVGIMSSDDIIAKYGSNGIADFAERMVLIQSGMENVALPEEALHFFLEMMPQDHPALVQALDQIRNKAIYKTTLDQYKDNPNYRTNGQVNFPKIAKEALAKELSNQMSNNDQKTWLSKLIDAIMEWIKARPIQKSPFDIIEEMFRSQDIAQFNTNIQSSEMFNQLTDQEQNFYKSQPGTKEQENTRDAILGLTASIQFEPSTHTLVNANDPLSPLKSVTTILGSDFYSELEGLSDEMLRIYEDAYSYLIPEDATDKEKVKIIGQKIAEELARKEMPPEELKEQVGPKLYNALIKAGENQAKTLFGTAVHELVSSVVLGKHIDLDKVDPLIYSLMDKKTLERLIYGTTKEPGIQGIIRQMIANGSVLMTEVPVGNGFIGGVIDLIEIKPDGTVELHDFKSKFLREEFYNTKKNLEDNFYTFITSKFPRGIKADPDTLPELVDTQRRLLDKYTQQLSIYKRLLMERGVTVGATHVIGIPYTLDKTSGKIDQIEIHTVTTKYDATIGDTYFTDIDPALDATVKKKQTRVEDKRVEALEGMSKDSLKESFVEALGKLTQIHTYYSKNKDVKAIYQLLTDALTKTNALNVQQGLVRTTLDNFDSIADMLTLQKNFLEMLDSSVPIIQKVNNEFERVRRLVPTTASGAAERIQELSKLRDFLLGYQNMFHELVDNIGTSDQNNPVVKRLTDLIGQIEGVKQSYINTLAPEVSAYLKDIFTDDAIGDMRRAYGEEIAAAKQRKDDAEVAKLIAERDRYLPSDKSIKEVLSGNHGDIGWFFGKFVAAANTPDLVIAGVAKRLKATLNQVRLDNKDLRDALDREFTKRANVYGNVGLTGNVDIKALNQALVYVAAVNNAYDDKEKHQLFFKSEFNESLYYDYNKLKQALNKALNGTDEDAKLKARKELKDFEQEYFESNFTDEYYKLTKVLDTDIMYQGKRQSVRDIVKNNFDRKTVILNRYSKEDINKGNMHPNDLADLQGVSEAYYQMKALTDSKGRAKTGDELILAQALQKYDENRKLLYDVVVNVDAFNALKEKTRLQYGEDSEEYKEWIANNTRLAVSEKLNEKRTELYAELATLKNDPNTEKVAELYRELALVKAPFIDENGYTDGTKITPEAALKVKALEEKIDAIRDSSEAIDQYGYTPEARKEERAINAKKRSGIPLDRADYNRLTELKIEAEDRLDAIKISDDTFVERNARIKEIYKELKALSSYEETKYYKEELERRKRDFAESKNVSYAEFKRDVQLNQEFKETEWFVNNHHIVNTVVFKDEDTGEEILTSKITKPIAIWTRNTPHKEFIVEKPARHFEFRVNKESYTDKNGKEIQLVNNDNRDIQGRYKPKSNTEYKAKTGKDHPYLNKDFTSLRDKYNNNTASARERVDYENLLYIHKTVLDSQEGIEHSQRLGLAVPFMEKLKRERVHDFSEKMKTGEIDGVKGAAEELWHGVKRKFGRTENDVDQFGIPAKNEAARLATIDNNEVRFIPVRFSSKGEASETSYDVWHGVLNYVSSINRKKALDKELAMINGLEQILGLEKNQPKSETNNLIINNIYKKYLPELSAKINASTTNTRLEVLKSFVNTVMFNEESFEGYDILGVNTQKAINALTGLTSVTILGLAPFNWTINVMSGNLQNLIEASAGSNYTFKQYGESKKIIYGEGVLGGKYGSVIKDMTEDFSKLGNRSFWGQIMEVFDPIQGEFENEYGEKTNFNSVKNIFKSGIMAGKIMGEWEIQMSAFIAFALNHKVYNGKVLGREQYITMKIGDAENLSLDEISKRKLTAIEEFNNLDTNLLDILELNKQGKLSIKDKYKNDFEFGNENFNDIIGRLHAMQKKLNGSYAKFDKTYVEKTSIGRLMFFFRKYFVPLGMARWGTRRLDYESASLEQGFYVTFWQTAVKDLLKMRFNVVANWNNYSDFQKTAIKKTLMDLGAVLVATLGLSLLGWDPDDKDNAKKLKDAAYAKQVAIFLLLRFRSESKQFMPGAGLQEINKIVTNPSLIFSETTQFINMGYLMALHAGELFGMDYDKTLYYQTDAGGGGLKDKGDSKLLQQMVQSFTGYSGKTFHPEDAIKGWQYSNRLK